MDNLNRQGTNLPGPDQDAMAQSEREEARSASPVNSTRNPNLSVGRDRAYSLGRVFFSKSVHNQSDDVGIELVKVQQSKANVIYDCTEGVALDSKVMEVQSTVLDSEAIGNKQRDIGARIDPGTGGNKTSLSTMVFSNYNPWVQWHKEIIVQKASLWYKEYIFRRILRQHEVPPTKDGRHIDLDASRDIPLIDERTGKEYINNAIRSSRYTIWSFLPCQLWFQFSKVANFFFLVTGIVQLIPGLSTTGTFTTILPLLFFLSFSIAREGYDDFRRYQLDKVENRRLARILYGYRPGGVEGQIRRSFAEMVQTSWKSVKSKVSKSGKKDIIEAHSVIPESNEYSETNPSAGIWQFRTQSLGDL